MIVLGVLVGLILLMVLVIIHELGHAIAARRNGVEVEEFGIGFPPRAKCVRAGGLLSHRWHSRLCAARLARSPPRRPGHTSASPCGDGPRAAPDAPARR